MLVLVGALAFIPSAEAVVAAFDFNSGDGGFISTSPTGAFAGPFVYSATGGVSGSAAWSSLGQAAEDGHPNTTLLTSPLLYALSTGIVLAFEHVFSFEDDGTKWDGGVIRLSINGGTFNVVPGASILNDGYNGSVAGNSSSELAGQPAFTGNQSVFATSTALLTGFTVGDVFRVQFMAAGDSNTVGNAPPQWTIDNVNVINAVVVPEPGMSGLLVGGLALTIGARRRRAR